MKHIVKILNWLPIFILFVPLILEGRYPFFRTMLDNFYWWLLATVVVLLLLNYAFNKKELYAVFHRPRKRIFLSDIILIPTTLVPAIILFLFAGFSIFGIFCYTDASIYTKTYLENHECEAFEDMRNSEGLIGANIADDIDHIYIFAKELQVVREFLVHDENFRSFLIFIYLLSYLIFMQGYKSRLKCKITDEIEHKQST